jgi:hypothetical protein
MKYLISFADTRYLKTLERVRSQADDMAVYDNIITYTEEDLDPDFSCLSTILPVACNSTRFVNFISLVHYRAIGIIF